jgi:hypothetical protein
MRLSRIILLFCILSILIMLIGCSRVNDPVAPSGKSYESLPVGVSEFDKNGNPSEGYGALGIFEINIDTQNLSGEIHSLRSASSQDVLEVVDISNFLRISPCQDCVKIHGVEMNPDGNLVVYIGIRHPFPPGDPMKPPSGANRADLHVFNVEGLVIAETPDFTNFPVTGERAADFMLLNADGYSSYLDDSLDDILDTGATMHPYILHFDDYTVGNFNPLYPTGFESVVDPPPSGNLVMAMGCDYDVQPYEFNLVNGETLHFIYAVGCTYAVSADSKAKRFQPEYRVPQHLKKAASEIHIRITDNTLEQGNPSGSATIAIDVVDISQDVAVGSGLDQMKADSSVGSVRLEIPGILTGIQNVPLNNTGGSGHDPSDPLTYIATVTNQASAPMGIYKGLVKVVDTYPAGSNSSPLLLGNDGITRVSPSQNPLEGLFAIPEFATYQVFEIEVYGVVNQNPIAVLLPQNPTIYENNTVNFNGTTSSDPDGTIVLYEFDFDWNGIPANFTVDESNTTGTAVSDPYTTQGTYTAGLRVTDNLGGLGYDSSTITVNEYTGTCPDAPFAGYTMTQPFSYDDYYSLSSWTEWYSDAGATLDADIMSTGDGVCIYAETGAYDGELRIFDPYGDAATYTILQADWPGEQGTSVDVDSADVIVFVTATTYFDNDYPPDEWNLNQRNSGARTYFTVVDPAIGVSSAQQVDVGAKIQAIDIDGYDDVWVIDVNNVMHKYTKTNGYTEDMARQFDLDVVSGSTFTGLVCDFAINFYNEAFFVLTLPTPVDLNAKGSLWRFECNGEYNSSVGGNPNPKVDIFSVGTYGIADITIDNLDASGNQLTGAQDSQIVVVGGIYSSGWNSLVVRVDSELNAPLGLMSNDSNADGLTNVMFDQRLNELWGFERGIWADSWTERWIAPAEWQ